MSVEYQTDQSSWIAGTPWRDMRIHAGIRSGSGERSMQISGYGILNRDPEWILTSDDYAGFMVPSTKSELGRIPGNSGRIIFSSYFRYGQPWIRVVCIDRELEKVFLHFCETALEELSRGKGVAETLQLTLERFRQLFEDSGGQVSSECIVGLFAELVTLEWMLDGGVNALPGWLGPTRETHDFVLGKVHMEVKALRASGAGIFHVSNIHQMADPPDGRLYLVGVTLKPGDLTVGILSERIRTKLKLDQINTFDNALKSIGCSFPVDDRWNRLGFANGGIRTWLVNEDFPRLVTSMLPGGALPPGVGSVKYTVALEHAVSNEVLASRILQELTSQSEV